MGWLSSLPIKRRLMIGFGTILFMLLILTIIGINKVNFIDRTLSDITDINSVKQRYAINFRGSVHDRAIAIRDVSIASSSTDIDAFAIEIAELAEFYLDSERKMQSMMSSDIVFTQVERDILNRISSIQTTTLPLIEDIIER